MRPRHLRLPLALCALLASASPGRPAADEPIFPPKGDIPASFDVADASFDYVRRSVMIRMRDGVKLHTVILVPRRLQARAPILLTRTPYGADKAASRNASGRLEAILPTGDDIVALSGYIRVFQDVRGKYGSEGDYVVNRPLRGPLNPTRVDHATDTWDTIDWLVKNVAESNGRVGLIGTSYPGFLTLMGLVDPHPALHAAVPINPMVDCWVGDDWFHNGAFRQVMLQFIYVQTASKRSDLPLWSDDHDEFDRFLAAGSAGDLAKRVGMEQLPFWRRVAAHPAYDAFWSGQALDRILAGKPVTVPTLHVHGLWDQEDIYGAPAVWAAMEAGDTDNDRNHLVIGPWRHSGSNGDGSKLGPLRFAGDTGYWFRSEILQPFLDQHLKVGAPPADTPPVLAYRTGANRWQRFDSWPPPCEAGCDAPAPRLYLQPGFRLDWTAPTSPESSAGDAAQAMATADSYVSDPARPVPYRQRPIRPLWASDSTWREWLVDDQRFVTGRPDVLTYYSDVLTEPLSVAGQPLAHLFAETTGTDADWVVKLIDVYPPEHPAQPELGGYHLAVAMDILRGRYRDSREHPMPAEPGVVDDYTLPLPTTTHVFQPGHRIAVQIQSTWFPLYDRNPQTWVDNIFHAPADAYRPATHTIHRSDEHASYVELPVGAEP